jgi:hypothetical protein
MALMNISSAIGGMVPTSQDSADGSWSLSYDIGLQALSAMLGTQLRAFHQVLHPPRRWMLLHHAKSLTLTCKCICVK